ncbi:UDP-N-acetylmuramoyl-L-alanine--D-glutamate ligase [Bogoriella caseilytica]|uniref:UDP-N-acetylmuramoylalanine--D-glutamate ligase n=1 Tax=Bogoriella caseilytica TaxID=56055 RepID=A0A3N2B9B3_9MICO|nr:UDP-N-acetylmuramoyl-L-alanine--D-glutamate ligase [Bogoriella caseilytica]ROR71841.1 UDP-N-acetylmuramoylalanine--D-glutamate ligase [Bogoriella caseilytica]
MSEHGRLLDGARVAVAGLGASGRAALEVLATVSGARELIGYDASEAAIESARSSGEVPPGVRWHAEADGAQLAARIVAEAPDVLVVSPGFPATGPLHQRAAAAGLEVWSEIELAWRVQARRADGSRAPWLTLTGTNGKTTTVQMLSSILTAAGERAPAVGNVGDPVVRVSASGAIDVLAVELSSFQLHATHTVAAQASACLNLADDHLDWHGGFGEYRAAKARVYERTTSACIYNADAPVTREMVEQADVAEGCRAVGTTLAVPQVGQLGLAGEVLCDRAFGAPLRERQRGAVELAEVADLAHLAPGAARTAPDHVLANALSAAALARAHGVPAEAVSAGLRAMQPGAHRIATVATVAGVTYVDDTKATNAHAAAASLGALPDGSVVWVAGGLAKGAQFDDLVGAYRHKLRAVVLIGLDRAPLRDALARHAADVPVVEIEASQDEVMAQAVTRAARFAQQGDTVLLAPASASMDQFRNYAARGEAFAAAVRARQEAQ